MKLIHFSAAAAALVLVSLTAPSPMAFGAADGAPGKMSELPSGLKYTDTNVGTGAEATKGHKVSVHYTGWLYNNGAKGAKFDSSLDRGQPFGFALGAGQVIRGWDEGVVGMKIGGKRTLIIPPELGYGARGAGGVIPPNATLMFDVELLGVQ
jgi:FKBP-type peptidyl-prolyl cis-trans isomerase